MFFRPLSRFGDTAANAGTLALLDSYESTENLPVAVKTIAASAAAGGFRIFLMPVDATKTIMQACFVCQEPPQAWVLPLPPCLVPIFLQVLDLVKLANLVELGNAGLLPGARI